MQRLKGLRFLPLSPPRVFAAFSPAARRNAATRVIETSRIMPVPFLDRRFLNPDTRGRNRQRHPKPPQEVARQPRTDGEVPLSRAMPTLFQDFRFALRQLRKSPGFAMTTILTLGLGIGATTAIFSLVNAVLLRPLPFPEPDRLVWMRQLYQTLGAAAAQQPEMLSYPDFFDWRAQTRSFSAMASYRNDSVTLSGSGAPQHLDAEIVSAEFFRVLGMRPVLGRDFLSDDEEPGARVAMLSYRLWQSTFGGARDIAGRAITLDNHRYTVAGVMPLEFTFPIRNPAPALWTTLADDAVTDAGKSMAEQRGANLLDVVARLKPGVSLVRARAELNVMARNLAAQYPDTNKAYTATIALPVLERLAGDFRPAMRLLFAAVALVLLIACANVAGLLLARASHRRPEIALRAALGASRFEITRQILVEAVFLSLCGGALGVGLCSWIIEVLPRFVPEALPRVNQVSIDGPVLAFVLLVSLLTGLLFGGLPAWRMSRLDPAASLREGSRGVAGGRGQHRLHDGLVIAETAIGLVLLVASGLLIRSFVQVLAVDPGFDPRQVLTASLNLPDNRYSRDERIRFYGRLLPRLAALPGVQSAAAGWPLPLSGASIGISFQIEGRPVASADEPSEALSIVTADYFRTMRIPILAGRAFTERDDTRGAPVIIINQSFARKYFPAENPIGKHIQSDLGDGVIKSPMREVVGIAGDVKSQALTAAVDPQYYLPWAQAVILSPTLCIRTAGDASALAGALRAQLAAMDRDIPLYRVGTLEDAVYKAAAQPRFQAFLLACFAAMALLLSAVGLYAVLSYMVVRRTGEIGVRMALGAQRADVLAMVLKRGILLAAAGLVIGLGVSAILTRYLTDLLFRTPPLDAATFLVVPAILLTISLAASSLPAWRAARVDPMRTLRDQ